jgi:hypothetical protein
MLLEHASLIEPLALHGVPLNVIHGHLWAARLQDDDVTSLERLRLCGHHPRLAPRPSRPPSGPDPRVSARLDDVQGARSAAVMELHGVVESGQHLMKGWYERDQLLSKLLGVQIHPGSINVFVSTVGHPELPRSNHPFFREHEDEWMHPNRGIRAKGHLLVRDCTLNGHRAFLLRTEQPGKVWDGPGVAHPAPLVAQPNIAFEIVAEFIPGIAYGSAATLVFDPDLPLRTIPVPHGL